MAEGDVQINDRLIVPAAELSYRASRSGGPGGQHVNTSSTRVELVWDVGQSGVLTEEQRERLREKLATRISGEGLLAVSGSTSRSQHRNRQEVTERFAQLVREALEVPKPRRRTRPPRAAAEERLRVKKLRSEAKKRRRDPGFD
jgi:ribosome-associated protein